MEKTYTYVQVPQATEQMMERNGKLMLVPDYEVESYWVRLEGYDHIRMSDVIALYHDHATFKRHFLYFFVSFLVYIPKKEIYFISKNKDGIGSKHKKGLIDHASMELATKSKSISIHHGFRSVIYFEENADFRQKIGGKYGFFSFLFLVN